MGRSFDFWALPSAERKVSDIRDCQIFRINYPFSLLQFFTFSSSPFDKCRRHKPLDKPSPLHLLRGDANCQ